MGIKGFAICLFSSLFLLGVVFLYGWNTGYNASEREYMEKIIELTQESRAHSSRISELVRKEKQLLQEIKNDKIDCKEVLNFNLRSCFPE